MKVSDNPRMDAQGRGPKGMETRGKGLEGTGLTTLRFGVNSRGEGLTHGTGSGEPEVMGQNRNSMESERFGQGELEVMSQDRNSQGAESSGQRASRERGPRLSKGETNRERRRRRRYASTEENSDDTDYEGWNKRKKRYEQKTSGRESRPRERRTYSSSDSRDYSPRPSKRARRSGSRIGKSSSHILDKFLFILDKVKSSDKPKITFNTNVIPEFDPLSKEQTILTWITKVEECAEIYGWEEREIIHYSLPKLTGIAKTWYQGLTSILHTWTEWKRKLIESFPCREDYAELLTEMLAKKVKYGESLEHYYYAKVNLLNRCKIYGKQAVDCLLYGIEDRAVKIGAQAAQFKEPEQVLSYFRTVKVGQSRDTQEATRRYGRFGNTSNRPSTSKSGNNTIHSNIICFNCSQVGHPSFRCDKPLNKCTICNRMGHSSTNCFRNPMNKNTNETEKNKTPENNQKPKQVSEVMKAEDIGINKYVLDIRVNESKLSCHVDLGSQCSLIRLSDARMADLQITTRPNLPLLRGVGASLIHPIGVVEASVEVQGLKETVDLYVVEDYVISYPVLLGHSFTERPDILIIKTPFELKFQRIPPNKINLIASVDIQIPGNTMRAVQVTTDTQADCEVYVNGTLRGTEGKEYYLLPGQYEIKNGQSALLVYNVTPEPISIIKGMLLTRSQQKNSPSCSTLNSFSVTFDDAEMNSGVNCSDNLSQVERQELQDLLSKYSSCFSSGLHDLGHTSVTEMKIELDTADPVVYRPYRMSHTEKGMVRNMIQEMIDSDIIRESSSPYASPIIMVQKKTGDKRLCVDYRALNRKTKKDHYPIPRVEDQLDLLAGNKLFTSLDLASGYYQIPLSEESRPKTAFVTPDGQYEFNRMPFGLVNAPSVFQRTINKILMEAKIKYAIVYMDDILIPSKDFEEGMQRLGEVLELLKQGGLTLKLSKCHFFLESIDFLGFDVSASGIRPGTRKIEAVSKFPTPCNQHEVRQFLGLSGFFRRFIKGYAIITAPLTDLLKKNTGWVWGQEQEQAFIKVKDLLINRPVLALYDPKAVTELHTDACKDGLAGILLQRNLSGVLQPVSFFSRKTTVDERKLHSYELETLAVVASLNRFRVYLIGMPFKILTDCNALRSTLVKRDLIPRVARWWVQLQEFDFTIEYRPGPRMAHADALSRNPVESFDREQHVLDVLSLEQADQDWISTVQSADDEVKKIKDILSDPNTVEAVDVNKNYAVKIGRVYRIVGEELKWLVPRGVRWQIRWIRKNPTSH